MSTFLAVGGLVACGPEQQGDGALAASAAAATATATPTPAPAPSGQGECRRWTTCVPENPCHTGWVTGCRKNVPICTDIGGWLSNGTTCGNDAVCSMGECVPCAAGASCPIAGMYGSPDACRVGAIACGTGQPVCVDEGPAADGTACMGGGPYVCKGGVCTWCQEGSTCNPPDHPCHVGTVSACATGGTCTDTGAVQPNGAWCGGANPYASVCRDGECVACAAGQPCTPDGSCWQSGWTDCSSGWPVCQPSMPKPDGTVCEGGGVCQGGTCVPPCVPDQPCTPYYDACYSGRTVCYGATSGWCEATSPLPDGTACAGGVCKTGSCAACGAGSWCPSPDPCYGQGTISCATARCEPAAPARDDGWSCGAGGETCQAAVCTDDADPRLVVRAASGSVDLTGTSWVRCVPNGSGTSQRVTRTFGVGTSTRAVETFATPDCGGEPLTRTSADHSDASAGDRYVSWTGGTPPPGVWMWSPTATAVHVTSPDQGQGAFDLRTLFWIDDWSYPRRLFLGDGSQVAADGYPTLLTADTNPLTEAIPPCIPDQPCTPGNACQAGRTVCWDAYHGTCEPRDPLPDGASCGTDLVCSNGQCLSCGSGAWCPSPDACHASGTMSCATGRCDPQPPASGDGLTCGAGGETCQGGTCTAAPGAAPWVRSTFGAVDLTGTTWSACMTNEPDPGMSRLRIDSYVVGGITHEEVVFTASLDCTGPTDPARGFTISGTMTSGGDRLVTWDGGYPPVGLPWQPEATAVHFTAVDSPIGPIDFKDLVFVNDATAPRQLYQGENKRALLADGYPALLVGSRPMTEVLACNAGAPCTPGFPTCEVFRIDCSAGAPVCTGTGTFLAEGTRCGDGHASCQAGACLPVPTRTVTGTSWMTYWPDAGAVSTTDPTWLRSVAAVQFAAGFTYDPGMVFPDGTFAIAGVETGPYHLEAALPSLRYVHTTSSSVDLGIDVLGRRDVAWPTGPTPVLFDVKGLVPWSRGDVLEFFSSNAGVAAMPFGGQESTAIPVGVPELAGQVDWNGRPLVSGRAGDVAYVFQASTTTAPTGERVTAASGFKALPPDFEILDVLGGTVDVTLDACPAAGAVSADWRRAEFEAYGASVHPQAIALSHRIVVGARPHAAGFAPGFRVGELAAYPGVPLLVVQATAPAADTVLSGVGYGRFLPPLWREIRHDRLMFAVDLLAPGATRSARLNAPLGYDVPADLAPQVVAPIVAPPGSLAINGQDAWSGVAGAGAHPRLTWIAPAVSPAAAALFPGASLRYRVTLYELRVAPDGGTQVVSLFEARTERTGFNVPVSLAAGSTYVAAVEAALTADSLDAPLRTSIESAYATVVSRPFAP